MSIAVQTTPVYLPRATFPRLSVDAYHRLLETGIIEENNSTELLEGYLVLKMAKNPPHAVTLRKTLRRIVPLLPAGWDQCSQDPVTLIDSEPEPDVAIVRGDGTTYIRRHPRPADIGLVIEVSDATLESDQKDKTRIYARSAVVAYWIVNIPQRQVEVYTLPTGGPAEPHYGQCQIYPSGSAVPFILDGALVGHIPVDELLP